MAKRLEINWDNLYEEHRSSKLSIKAFCAQKGISENSFYQYRRKINTSGIIQITPNRKSHIGQHLILRFKDLSIEVNSETDPKVLENVLNLLGVIQ